MASLAYYQKHIAAVEKKLKSLGSQLKPIGHFAHQDTEVALYGVEIGQGSIPILLTAGTHGEEQAGPLGLRAFIEQDLEGYLKDFRFTIIPVINPIGFNKKRRRGSGNRDLNRYFGKEPSFPENKITLEFLAGKTFDHHFDMHEDIEEGLYMYESGDGVNDPQLLEQGYALLKRLEDLGLKVNQRDRIMGMRNDQGIIYTASFLKKRRGKVFGALPSILLANGQARRFTNLETSRRFPLEERIAAQVYYLNYWLQLKLADQSAGIA